MPGISNLSFKLRAQYRPAISLVQALRSAPLHPSPNNICPSLLNFRLTWADLPTDTCPELSAKVSYILTARQAVLVPSRICTLSLVSTAAGVFNTSGFVENIVNRANLFIPKSLEKQIETVKHNLYSEGWLDEPDTLENVTQSFPTNGDRFAANELWKRGHETYFTKKGFMLQLIAAGWHYKSPAQLASLAKEVGKRRIMVVHGTKDRMITFPHAVVLWRGLEKGEGRTGKEFIGMEDEPDVWEEGEVEKRFVRGQGHVLPIEMRQEFGSWLEELVKRGEELNAKEGI